MKLPRDVRGEELVRALRHFGYAVTRQAGSHVALTWSTAPQHHLTVPMHRPIKTGTLSSILKDFGARHGLELEDVVRKLRL
jgi:predicted RNA binding protein YcfA (HicA-like mRNA interferase family)